MTPNKKVIPTKTLGITLSVVLMLLVINPTARSADWTVQQSASLSGDEVSVSQKDSASAVQAINGIRLETDEDIIDNATQSASITTDLSLTQDGVLSGSIQAVNFAEAESIRMLDQSVNHSGTSSSASLNQDIMSGTGNIQAMNAAHATNNVQTVTQKYIGQTLQLTSGVSTPADNIQAVNFLRANSYSGILTQEVTVDSLIYENLGDGLLYINTIQIPGAQDPGNDISIRQSVTVDSMQISPETGSTTVIINHRGL